MIVNYDKETDMVYISKRINNRWVQVGLNRDEVHQIQIARSNPYNPQAEQENLVRMILIEIIDYIDAGYEADEIQKIYEEKFDIKLRQSKDGEP
jgi:hypothetical protein